MVATDLIAGWWRSDRLFCVAVGFLALVFALATVAGVILLLQRRSLGRYLIAAGRWSRCLPMAASSSPVRGSPGSCTRFRCCRWPALCSHCTPEPSAGSSIRTPATAWSAGRGCASA
ncbi:hypothetical protein I553_4344 [Mycobacterium xenopi 4042]|uniref:Uncharacterized protein n=1 Tax=Mycobacterium xenopi 4042 TaxID=1299334 RepID=X8AGE3_MYCXE|nr:hypothetical protein I553_4344 [Mycobacterium xenopi 4042]